MADRTRKSPSAFRANFHLRKGGLHKALGISEDKHIPAERLQQALHSKVPHIRKMAVLAHTMRSWHHK